MQVIAALQRFYCNDIRLGSNPPKHPYHGRMVSKGIQHLLVHQRKKILFQRCSMCSVLSEKDTQHAADLSVCYKISDLYLFWFLHEPFQGREKLRWKIGSREKEKTVSFVHGLTGGTVCSVERKQREIALLPFKHSEYILNIKTDFSSNIFFSPAKINVVWFGTLVILLVNASVLFRY